MRQVILAGLLACIGCSNNDQMHFSQRDRDLPLIVNESSQHYAVGDIDFDRLCSRLVGLARTADAEEAFLYDPYRRVLYETGEQECYELEDDRITFGVTQTITREDLIDLHIHPHVLWEQGLERGIPANSYACCVLPSARDLQLYAQRTGRFMVASSLGVLEVRSSWASAKTIARSHERYESLFDLLTRLDVSVEESVELLNDAGEDGFRGVLKEKYDEYCVLVPAELAELPRHLADAAFGKLADLKERLDMPLPKMYIEFNFFPAPDCQEWYDGHQKCVDFLHALTHYIPLQSDN